MTDARLTLTADEHAALLRITREFPGLVAAIEAHVARLLDETVPRLQGLVTTEGGVDDVLTRLVERVVALAAPQHEGSSVADDACGVMTLLIARNAAARARDGIVQRLVGAKRN